MSTTVYIACDHAAFLAKEIIKKDFKSSDLNLIDLGTCNEDRVDYPHFAELLVKSVVQNADSVGILLCGSGIGVSMVANRFKGIRAALCKNALEARLAKQHNNANVLCLDGRLSDEHTRREIIHSWLEASFEGGRHQSRIDMFNELGIDSLGLEV